MYQSAKLSEPLKKNHKSQGHTQAQLSVGMLYATGQKDVILDRVEAYAWFNLAASQGDRTALNKRKTLVRGTSLISGMSKVERQRAKQRFRELHEQFVGRS